MNSPRATLATIVLLLTLAACAEQSVVATEPSRAAPITSIPGSSSVTIKTGQDAARFLETTAAAWSRNGDSALSHHLEAQRALAGQRVLLARRRAIGAPPSAPILEIAPDGSPSPSTTPNAIIYYSSTAAFVSGRSATIVSSVTYYGNIAISNVTYSANDFDGRVVIPQTTVTNRGLGENVPCMGSSWECSWTFKLQTVVSLDLGQECGIIVTASGAHTAQWTIPAAGRLPGATWGSTYSGDSRDTADNGACAPPPTCVDATATNYGGPLPCAYPPPPPPPSGGDGSTPPPSGDTPTEPVVYEPAPFVPSGHWECTVWYMGTDYETEHCTWYDDYTRISLDDAARARGATDLASAQSRLGADLPSVFVVVSDQVPADAMAVIERHRQGPYRNVLLVSSAALRPATLVAALRALSDSRGRHGETPAKDIQLTLKGSVLDQQIPRTTRDYAAAFTALVARATRADVGSYGTRQVLEIRLADRK